MSAVHIALELARVERRAPAPFTVVSFEAATEGVNADVFCPYTYETASADRLEESAHLTSTDSTRA